MEACICSPLGCSRSLTLSFDFVIAGLGAMVKAFGFLCIFPIVVRMFPKEERKVACFPFSLGLRLGLARSHRELNLGT